MSSFLFAVSRGPEDAARAVRAMFLAKVAAAKGHEVCVFLLDEGVYWTNLILAERARIPTGDVMLDQIKDLQAKGARFLVCKPCADARLIAPEDLPPGFDIGTAGDLIDLAAEAKVFTF